MFREDFRGFGSIFDLHVCTHKVPVVGVLHLMRVDCCVVQGFGDSRIGFQGFGAREALGVSGPVRRP